MRLGNLAVRGGLFVVQVPQILSRRRRLSKQTHLSGR
nr:MAG TPA: Sodium/potassium-transporting ATPase subunit alpha-1 [Caudoviricetes sp.]